MVARGLRDSYSHIERHSVKLNIHLFRNNSRLAYWENYGGRRKYVTEAE